MFPRALERRFSLARPCTTASLPTVNASAREMANYVQFFLNRGSFGGLQLVQAASIERMERPATTLAANEGMIAGYGLGNYTTIEDGFVYHGHNGGVEGGLTEMAYLPDHGLGYIFMINSSNGTVFDGISKLIRGYMTRDLKKPPVPAPAALKTDIVRPFLGYVEPTTPRQEILRFLTRILGVSRISLDKGKLVVGPLLGKLQTFVPVSDLLFRRENEPLATLALIPAAAAGPAGGRGKGRPEASAGSTDRARTASGLVSYASRLIFNR